MKKTWFDSRLFRDAMRQLRVSGLVAGLVLVLQAVLIPIGQLISEPRNRGWQQVGLQDINPLCFTLFCVIAPLMALYLFRFLSQRGASDFYHSLPQTRICLYISFTAAVLCWALILHVVSTLAGIGMHLLFPSRFHVDFGQILLFSVQLMASVVFVVGAVMLAVTLTGNALTNLAVSLLIIFFPRLIMLVIKSYVGDSLTIVNQEFLSFLGNDWNVVTGSVFAMFSSYRNLFGSVRAGSYTAALGVLYLILGCVMFDRRKSERAGEASVSQRLQLVFRLLPAAVFCLIPNVRVFTLFTGAEQLTGSAIYTLFILYLVGIFLYFMYELVSTRKVRNLPKAIPGLVFLVAFNLLVIFGMLGLRRNLMSFQPEASQIESVQLTGDDVYVWDGNEGTSVPGYLTSRASKLELTDENVRELVALRLKETVAYDETPWVERDYEQDFYLKEVAIRTGGRVRYRQLRLLQSDIKELAETLRGDVRIQDIYMELPDSADPSVKLALGTYYYGNNDDGVLSDERVAQIYEAMKEDARDMGFEEWYSYCTTNETGRFTLYMTVQESGEVTGSAFPLSEKTPKAMAACIQAFMEKQGSDREEMIGFLSTYLELQKDPDAGLEVTYSDAYVVLRSAAGMSDDGGYYDVDILNTDQVEELLKLLRQQSEKPYDSEKGYMEVTVNVEYLLGTSRETGQLADVVNAADVYTQYNGTILFAIPENPKFRALDPSRTETIEDLTEGLSDSGEETQAP